MESTKLGWERIVETARRFEGILLTTLDDATKFYVAVDEGEIYFFPMPEKRPVHAAESAKRALVKFNQTRSMDPEDYSARSFKPGFILRLIELATTSPRQNAGAPE